jgi:hypothetical protein
LKSWKDKSQETKKNKEEVMMIKMALEKVLASKKKRVKVMCHPKRQQQLKRSAEDKL